MDIKKYSTNEILKDKSIKRKIIFESRIINKKESELIIQVFDIGELDIKFSILIDDKIEMKKIRQILNHCINRGIGE